MKYPKDQTLLVLNGAMNLFMCLPFAWYYPKILKRGKEIYMQSIAAEAFDSHKWN